MFWKVTLDKSGDILTCEEAEPHTSTKFVVYVEADTKAGACTEAKAWAARRRDTMRAQNARRYAVARATGLCSSCHATPARPGRTRCPPCTDSNKRLTKERRAGRPARARLSDEQKFVNAQSRNRLLLYAPSVLREFDARGPEGFRAWLVQKIEDAKTFEQAAEDVRDSREETGSP